MIALPLIRSTVLEVLAGLLSLTPLECLIEFLRSFVAMELILTFLLSLDPLHRRRILELLGLMLILHPGIGLLLCKSLRIVGLLLVSFDALRLLSLSLRVWFLTWSRALKESWYLLLILESTLSTECLDRCRHWLSEHI